MSNKERTPLHEQVDTLPELVDVMVDRLVDAVARALPRERCHAARRVFLTGCGDSHHAGVNAELAFELLAGVPARALPAMQFSRYVVDFLPPEGVLVLAVSVSGQVSRTFEALDLARQAGATAVAVTGNPTTPLAQVGDAVVETAVPPLPAEQQGLIVPGTRSYVASQLALYLAAIHIGQQRGHLAQAGANRLRRELVGLSEQMEATIAAADPAARQIAAAWHDASEFVFCGAGPNYGTALFSAAKVLEASGDTAVAQDTEEWAHLHYFARAAATPTFLLSAADRDLDRALEVAAAAKAIGRRVAIVAPTGSPLAQTRDKECLLPLAGPVRECFSPLLACLPPTLFAAYHAQALGEPYFRNFGGGRSAEGGGGISRIRTSHRRETPDRSDTLPF